ncbi:MAG TPA: type II secretion system F family protein [Blastocatellia bacterium]|nr:type II secretion system F family protein [Blastocatellia bacterium]
MIPFFVFLFCLLATYATYLLMTRKSAAQRAQMERRMAEVLAYSTDLSDEKIKLTKDEFLSEIPTLNEFLKRLRPATQLKLIIEQADLQITVMRLCMFSALAGLLGWLAASMVSITVVVNLCAGLIAAAVPFLHVQWKRNQRFHKFLVDLPDALDLMGRALAAGHSFSEALHIIATEMPDPIATEFRRTYDEQNLGLSLKVALESLTERIPLLDLQMCVTAVLIQRETGGNMAEILEKVAVTIRERFRILEDLKTLTTSSRLSAWVLCGIPIFVALSTTWVNPEYMSVFWYEPTGQKLLALAVGLQIAGMLVVRKILQIKV